MESEKLKIEIWSDIVCPFCYLGKKKLQRAINKLGISEITEIIWHSFQLDPDFPVNFSISSTKYISEKKNIPTEQLHEMHQYLFSQGKSYGIDFQFGKALSFNTNNAHRLWQWTKKFNKSNEAKEALFKAYFTDGIDLSQSINLLNVIENLGLNRAEAERILESHSYEQELEEDRYQSRQLGIRGVPYFLINNKEVISGAQDDKVFENVLSAGIKTMQLYRLRN
jgi:predicted DsbA family dithiol-disulfide isomerase